MTLNSSGPISLGGSTTGQSINLELGFSATALASINSTSFRTLAGVASGQISLSNFYGKSNTTYFFASFKPPNQNYYAGHSINSSNGNIVFAVWSNSSSPYYTTVYRVATSGSLIGYNTFSLPGYVAFNDVNGIGQATIVVDTSCTVYGGGGNTLFTKYSPVTSTWYFSQANSFYTSHGITKTNGTNFYTDYQKNLNCCGCLVAGIIGYNSSGAIVSNYASNGGAQVLSFTYDGASSFYVTTNYPSIIKQTTSSISWLWSLPNSYLASTISANTTYMGFTQSNSQSIALYNIASATNTTPPTKIALYNVSGVSTLYSQNSACCYDTSNNFYYLQALTYPGHYGFLITKLNSSGTVQWQRSFTAYLNNLSNNTQTSSHCITAGSTYLTISYTDANSGIGLIQYPLDGSKTGSYNAGVFYIVVAASSYTYTVNTANGGNGLSTAGTAYSASITCTYTATTGVSVSSTNTFTTI